MLYNSGLLHNIIPYILSLLTYKSIPTISLQRCINSFTGAIRWLWQQSRPCVFRSFRFLPIFFQTIYSTDTYSQNKTFYQFYFILFTFGQTLDIEWKVPVVYFTFQNKRANNFRRQLILPSSCNPHVYTSLSRY